jgi:hypothetical protein
MKYFPYRIPGSDNLEAVFEFHKDGIHLATANDPTLLSFSDRQPRSPEPYMGELDFIVRTTFL